MVEMAAAAFLLARPRGPQDVVVQSETETRGPPCMRDAHSNSAVTLKSRGRASVRVELI